MTAFGGSCHCGAVRIALPRRPDYVNRCNCSICSKLGWQCVYFGSHEIEITGAVDSYTRSDLSEPMLSVFRCAVCGCPTHWEPLDDPPHARMGINARLLDEGVLDGVEIRDVDGRSWPF